MFYSAPTRQHWWVTCLITWSQSTHVLTLTLGIFTCMNNKITPGNLAEYGWSQLTADGVAAMSLQKLSWFIVMKTLFSPRALQNSFVLVRMHFHKCFRSKHQYWTMVQSTWDNLDPNCINVWVAHTLVCIYIVNTGIDKQYWVTSPNYLCLNSVCKSRQTWDKKYDICYTCLV